MQHLGLLFSLALLATNFWGLMLVTGFYWQNRWFALATGPLLGVTAVYAIECHHGLGPSLSGLCIGGTLLSAFLIALSLNGWEPANDRVRGILRGWRSEFAVRRLIPCFAVFGAVFLYALAW